LAILKAQRGVQSDKSNRIEKITGSFEGDADFEEILRLGKEMRDAEQPDYLDDEVKDTRSMFIFDTDHLGFLQLRQSAECRQIKQRMSEYR